MTKWFLLPHRTKIIITSDENCDFTGVTASDITIEDITVLSVISASGNKIEALIRIPPRVKPGEKEVTIHGDGGATLTIH